MFYRIRTRLPDSPGALAVLAGGLGEAGVNILALQIYPHLGSVTDDLVVEVPQACAPSTLLALVEAAHGTEVSLSVCSEHDLRDQPTQWLAAARTLLDDPARLAGELTRLLGPRVSLSPTEQVRAAALTDLARAFGQPATPARSSGAVVEYDETGSSIVARVGDGVVGAASYTRLFEDQPAEGSLEVAPAWRRRGIGRQLLRRLCAAAATAGAAELVLLAPADESGVAPLLAATGMRGRIRLNEEGLRVHLALPTARLTA